MEAIFSEGTRQLFQQGTGWVLFVLAMAVNFFMYREHAKFRKEVDDAKTLQFEKRLVEHGEIISALNRSSTTLAALQISVEARTEAINRLTTGFSELAKDVEVNRERWTDRLLTGERQLSELSRRIEEMQHHNSSHKGAA